MLPVTVKTENWSNNSRNEERSEESVYLKDSLMSNIILTLMYNIVKVKRRDTLNEVQTMSLCTTSSAGLPVAFHIKHGKYKNKNPSTKLFQDCLLLVRLLTVTLNGREEHVYGCQAAPLIRHPAHVLMHTWKTTKI